MNPRVIVVAPSYNPQIGGAIVLHKLCDTLNKLGMDAYLTTTAKLNGTSEYFVLNEDFDTKIAVELDQERDIVIYPEIERGNPFGARNVVRYILSKAHLVDVNDTSHSSTWGENDFWLYYHELFYDGIAEKNILHLLHPKLDVYKDLQLDRSTESCYTRRKNTKLDVLPDSSWIEVAYSTPDSELLYLFNRCKRFYSYDTETYLSVLAALSGCESVIIPEDGKTKEDIVGKQPSFKYGIAYGIEDIQHARDTIHLVRGHLESLEHNQLSETADTFAKITKHFNL
jgi:hypothetical protein